MKIRSRDRRTRNSRGLSIRGVERLEGRQLLSSMNEYAITSSTTPRPTDITSGPDGNLWFVEQNSDKVGKITTGGVINEFSLPANSGPNYITTGADGNLWFTEPGSNLIGQITTAGVITQYPVLSANSGLGEITPGPDGALWFTEATADKIGRIDTAGNVSEYGGSGLLNYPFGITSGPDGNLWFTDFNGSNVGKIIPSGAESGMITLYPVSSGSSPRGITAGSDGNLWFVESSGLRIGKVTTEGSVTEYAIPNPDGQPSEITSGPNGDLFYSNINSIGEVTTKGVFVNNYLTPTSNSNPDGLTTGPDGKIWFTEYIGDQIGSLSLVSSTTLSVTSTSGIYGGSTTVQATLSAADNGIGNKLVDFHLGTNDLGTATTDVNGVASISNVSLAGINAGSYLDDVTASFVGDADFTPSSGAANLTVTPASLTIAAVNQTIVYGDTVPELTALYTGLVNGDSSSSLTPPPTITSTVTSTSDVGAYSIVLGEASDPNYNITLVNGQIAVTPAPVIVTVDNASKVYGQINPLPVVHVTGARNGDSLSALYAVSASTYSDVTPNGYPILYQQLIGTKASDYSTAIAGSLTGSGTLIVTPAPLTINIDYQFKVYGQATPVPFGTVTGVLNSDDVSAVYSDPAGQFSDVLIGGYAITLASLSGAKSADYSTTEAGASVTDGTLTIAPAPLTVEVADQSKVYGQTNPVATGLFSGTFNGDSISLTYGSQAGQFSDVRLGGYPISPTSISGLKQEDYSFTVEGASVNDGTLTITPSPLAVVVANASRFYGQANPTLQGSVGGVLNGDNVAATYGTTADATFNVGGYPIIVTGLIGAKAGDYSVPNSVPGTLTIVPTPLTITAVNQTRTYGQDNPEFTANDFGFVLGQGPSSLDGTLHFSTPATPSTDFGIYPVTPGGLTSANYAITYVGGGIAITPAALTVTAVNQTRLYGQANPMFTATYSGFVLNQGPSVLGGGLNFTTPATPASHFGIDPVSVSGLTSPNRDYLITYVGGGIAITPAPLTITAPSFEKVYGQAVPSLSAIYSGFVNGDTPSSLTTSAGVTTPESVASHVGFYPVIASGATSMDYAITENYGISAVFPTVLVATPGSGFVSYGQAAPSFDVSYAGFVNGDTAASLLTRPTVSTSANAASLPGFYPVVATGGSSYDYLVVDNYGIADVLTPAPASPISDPALSAFVASLYEDLVGRAPEPIGLGIWVNQLNQGVSQSSVAEQIYGAPEAVRYRAAHPNQAASLAVAYYDAVVSRSRVAQG